MDNSERMDLEALEQQVLKVHDSFWVALAEREVERRFDNCADDVTFIGSGLNEKASNKDEYFEINRKGLQQYSEKFGLQFNWRRVSLHGSFAVVETEVEWVMEFDDMVETEMLRNSVVLKKVDGKWLIVHVHGSIPDYRLAGQNYMTNAETSKRNIELERQVFQRTKELNRALDNLKSTQAQLIQSEKMASLGQLTAGIAHEIQNPLNFVNNFSEVSRELLDEMKVSLGNGDVEGAMEIANDVIQNLEKINHHGRRADAIVKGMLQHSGKSTGKKEPTDINALCDEYLRLAYHGFRAKTNGFNATTHVDFDKNIGQVDVVAQDIGRVLLNLSGNAFYAVHEQSLQARPGSGYAPTVSVGTKREGDKIEIRVVDNGIGIPHNIRDKIFQPFFTTKPTGQGTGLGLSLAYDIVKAHGGEIKVSSKIGEGSTFSLLLPV